MQPPNKKLPGARGIPPPFRQSASPAPPFKPFVAQAKTTVLSQNVKRPVAQTKAGPTSQPTPPRAAPSVYRPQAQPHVLQRKSVQPPPRKLAPAAYRPLPEPKVLQSKKANTKSVFGSASLNHGRTAGVSHEPRPAAAPSQLGARNTQWPVSTPASGPRHAGAAPVRVAPNSTRQIPRAVQTKNISNQSSRTAFPFAGVVQRLPIGPPNPINAKGATKEETDDKGRVWLNDEKGHRWLLRTSSLGNDYWWPVPKGKSKRGFVMYMRTVPGSMSMSGLAEQKNMIEALSWSIEDDEKSVMATAAPNPAKRMQQGTQMAKYFGADAVRTANNSGNGSYISASTYAGEDGWEWLHLHGHGIGGLETPDNLVAGSHGANTEMAAIECAVKKVMGASTPVAIRVSAALEKGERLGKPSVKATAIFYTITASGKPPLNFTIDASRDKLLQQEYDQLEALVTAALCGVPRPIAFLRASDVSDSGAGGGSKAAGAAGAKPQ